MMKADKRSARLPLRLLNDSAHMLESFDDPQMRARHVLQLLPRIVPNDGCVLLEATDGDQQFIVVPEPPPGDSAAALKKAMIACLQMIGDEPSTTLTSESTPQIAASIPWKSYLGLPLVGDDHVIGLLFVGSDAAEAYGEEHLGLLSVVAGQLSAYLTSVRLHEREMAGGDELAKTQAYARGLFNSKVIGIVEGENERITDANDAFLRIVGYTRQDLEGGRLNWREMTPPEYANLDDDKLRELETVGEANASEKEYVRKDGTRVPVLVGATAIQKASPRWVAFVLDQTERKCIEDELERTRSEFLGEVSHELKTPLTAIKGSTAMALASKAPPTQAEARELFEVIDEQAERLRELIGNLLDMTRIEAGSLPVNPQPTQLGQIVEDAVATFARTARERLIDVAVPPSLPPVIADRRRIGQVIGNLLSNASKASAADAPIMLSAERHDQEVWVRVRDNGRGIPLDKLPLLFRKFSQVHQSGGRGTGLGLAISRGIVEAHGGRIWAESAGEGEGATFTFTLPGAKEASDK
jgi:PAS domain S-box-containing protein